MSPRPFDPSELDQPSTDADRVISELDTYLATTATDAPRGLEQRVMAAVEREPAPRRGFIAWLLAPPAPSGGLRRFARAGALAATLALAVAGALFAGQLADLVRNVGSGSQTPTESVSPSPSETVAPTLTTSPELTSSESAEASDGAGESPEAPGTSEASENETPEPSLDTSAESKTASPSPSPTQAP